MAGTWNVRPAATFGTPCRPQTAAPFDPDERPPLSRPLNESILSVLREEAARELQARNAEDGGKRPDAPDRANDPDWPATTVTHPAPRMSADILAQRMERDFAEVERDSARPVADPTAASAAPRDADAAVDAADGTDSDQPATREEGTLGEKDAVPVAATPAGPGDAFPLPAESPAPAVTVTAPPAAAPPSAAPKRAVRSLPTPTKAAAQPSRPRRATARGAYNAGFGLAIMVALVLVALYALAPRLADQGNLGAQLMEWRGRADQGRDWLQVRADSMVDTLRR